MLIEAILISVIVGIIRGGRFRKLKAIGHKNMWVLVLGIVIQYLLFLINSLEGISMVDSIISFNREIQLLSYALILFGLMTNIRYKASKFILAGYVMKFMAVWGNGWKIPILSEGIGLINGSALTSLVEGSASLYTPISQGTSFPILGNIIVFADPYPLAKIVSLGDLLVGLGIFVLIQEIILGRDSIMGRRSV